MDFEEYLLRRVMLGSRDGMLSYQQVGQGSIPARCHVWVEFVVDSRISPSVFSGYFIYLLNVGSLKRARSFLNKLKWRPAQPSVYVLF